MSIDISKIGKLDRACSSPITRPSLAEPYLRITETVSGRGKSRKVERTGLLQATDSYVAVSIKVPVLDEETEGIVPLAALAFAKALKNRTAEVRLVGDRAVVFASGSEQASFPRGQVSGGTYWDSASITPKGTPVVVIGLNPRLLLNAADALGATVNEGLRIEIHDPLKPVCVSILGDPNRTALIQPMRIPS